MKSRLVPLILTVSVIFSLSACSSKQPDGNNTAPAGDKADSAVDKKIERKFDFTRENYPKVDGSTATIPLSEDMAAELLKMNRDEVKKFIKHNTTHNAYVNLLDGRVNIIFVTEPSEEELKMARDKGVELEVIPVVKDAFVFLVNTKNPVDSLSVKQIQDIYQGKIKNWKEAGGEDKKIIAYQRPKNSGSQTIMENMVMKGLKIADAPTEIKPGGMGELIEKVAGFDNSDRALGYSVYYYASSMYTRDAIKLIGVDGVKPDKNTIMSSQYPFTSAYYAVLRKTEPAGSSARALLEWLLSDEGQKLAEKSGYIPLR